MTASPLHPTDPADALARARDVADRLRARLTDEVKGRDDVIELVLVALVGDGHVLLEDYPGSGKTTLAKALGRAITEDAIQGAGAPRGLPAFRRVQFTPDLLPSDVTGVMVFDTDAQRFDFRRGPVFAHVLLADELNRTSPKVQSALLEAMAEKQVTVDNTTHPLDALFFVIATQNPLDAVGTYPLPVAQLDRFLFKVRMTHVDRDAELAVLRTHGRPHTPVARATVARSEVLEARRAVRCHVQVAPAVEEALVDMARALRADPRVRQGVSTRALVLALPALQTRATLQGRDFVTPDDLAALRVPLFQHRLELEPAAADATAVIDEATAPALERLVRGTLG